MGRVMIKTLFDYSEEMADILSNSIKYNSEELKSMLGDREFLKLSNDFLFYIDEQLKLKHFQANAGGQFDVTYPPLSLYNGRGFAEALIPWETFDNGIYKIIVLMTLKEMLNHRGVGMGIFSLSIRNSPLKSFCGKKEYKYIVRGYDVIVNNYKPIIACVTREQAQENIVGFLTTIKNMVTFHVQEVANEYLEKHGVFLAISCEAYNLERRYIDLKNIEWTWED